MLPYRANINYSRCSKKMNIFAYFHLKEKKFTFIIYIHASIYEMLLHIGKYIIYIDIYIYVYIYIYIYYTYLYYTYIYIV